MSVFYKKNTKKKLFLIIFIFVCICVVIYFYLPRILYDLGSIFNVGPFSDKNLGYNQNYVVSNKLIAKIDSTKKDNTIYTSVTTEDKFILNVPKIGVNAELISGDNDSILNKGLWYFSMSATPDQIGGNVVILGHRWKYKPPNPETFFLLDKLENGDEFTLNYQRHLYRYKVINSKVIDPKDVSVIEQSGNDIVTLITCTPLYTTKYRLVVTGELIKN